MRKLLTAAHGRARALVKAHERELHALAAELLDKETLTGGQIKEVLAAARDGRAPAPREAAAAAG